MEKIKKLPMNPVKGDKKTKNIYNMIPRAYKKNNWWSHQIWLYIENINKEAKYITTWLCISDKVHVLCGKQALLKFNGHKNDFFRSPLFRLINPTKTELGIIKSSYANKPVEGD